ncbi:hypothetical protein F5141DRAFT_1068663 [Pisolithus sp. B1]|nr:hypothetical protein F5141DRAFT_1068663 [Pisolithus sp. B1]
MEVTRLEGKLGREQLFMHEGTKSRSKRIIQSSYGCMSKAIRGVGVWKVVGLGLEVGVCRLYAPYVQNRVHRCPARMTSVYAIVVYMAVLNFGSLILAPNKRHAKEEEMRIKLQQSGDNAIQFEANFLAATLSEPHAEDSVLSSRSMQIQHSSNRLPGRPPEGGLCRVDVNMVDISQTSDEITHDTNEKELLSTNNYHGFHRTARTFVARYTRASGWEEKCIIPCSQICNREDD